MPSNNLVHSTAEYKEAIRKLFPYGVYWDAQFDDPESDLSKWIEEQAEELYRFKNRFPFLIQEATPKTADTMIDDWERVLLGSIYTDLPLDLRRKLLLTKRRGHINLSVLEEVAGLYAAKIKRVYYPYRSAFFGHTRIGINRMCAPASFSVLFITVEIKNPDLKTGFERAIREALLANMIIYFFYD